MDVANVANVQRFLLLAQPQQKLLFVAWTEVVIPALAWSDRRQILEEDHASAGMTTLSSNTLDFWLCYSTHHYCSRYWTLLHMHVHRATSCRGDIAIVGWLNDWIDWIIAWKCATDRICVWHAHTTWHNMYCYGNTRISCPELLCTLCLAYANKQTCLTGGTQNQL